MKTHDATFSRKDVAAFMRLMLEESDQVGVVFIDTSGCIRGWNHAAAHITGFSGAEVVGKHCGSILFTPEDRANKLPEHELTTAAAVGFAHDERWHMRKDGLRFWSSGICMPLRDRKGNLIGYVKSYRDTTHLRTRIKFLENSVQEHALQQERNDAFIATLAHEMRNPLAPLMNSAQIIRHSLPPGGELERPLAILERQVAALQDLVEDLIDLTRVKTGRLMITYERVQLQELVAAAVDAARASAASKKIEISMVAPEMPITVELDSSRMHQVLMNLLNNSIKYTPAGGSVWVTATVDQTHALVFVKDNGVGVAPDLLPKIFDMFTQAPHADSQRGAGLGIGLALVKRVVELHQGTIEVRSEGHGKGSEFSVRVPRHRPHGSEPEPDIR